jgi:hypothetical protein
MNRIILAQVNDNTPRPTINEVPDADTCDLSCGWFLKWFHSMIYEHKGKTSFRLHLKELFGEGNESSNDPLSVKEKEQLLERAEEYAKAWKSRWHNFFKKLWNHKYIMDLIDIDVPQATQVEDSENGFLFIVETIAENIFEKVFFGCEILPPVYIRSKKTNTVTLHSNILLLNKNGR